MENTPRGDDDARVARTASAPIAGAIIDGGKRRARDQPELSLMVNYT